MDEIIINKWNEVVSPEDIVYHLGDFAFRSKNTYSCFNRLNGTKILIFGNHDGKDVLKLPWAKIYGKVTGKDEDRIKEYTSVSLTIDGQYITLSHFAHRTWDASHRNAWNLFGHSHATLPEDASLSFDVGWDAWGQPIDFATVCRKMEWKKKNGAPKIQEWTPENVRAFNMQFIR
ncbi:MAG TPA: hypothetical protein VMW91_09155 [Desulfosporosinus sp.]|nr:hypothetical protein [Desulfosporosinus sp.]